MCKKSVLPLKLYIGVFYLFFNKAVHFECHVCQRGSQPGEPGKLPEPDQQTGRLVRKGTKLLDYLS